jgi:adhesin/invasin
VFALAATLSCGGDDLILPDEGEPASLEIVQGDGQFGRVGEPLAEPIVARVSDSEGRPVPDVPLTLALDGADGVEVAPESAGTRLDGSVRFHVVLGPRTGAMTGVVRTIGPDGGRALAAPVRFTAVSADAAGMTLLAGDGQSAAVSTLLPEPLVVQVADPFGNPIAGVPIAWTLEGGGALSADLVQTDADGRASVERTLGATAGTQRSRASADGLAGSPVTFVHTATAGSAAALSLVSGDGQSAVVGTPLPEELVVRLVDAESNPVTGVPVTWVVGEGGGSVAPETSPTDERGRASTRWTLGPAPGTHTLIAVVSGVGTVPFRATATPGTPPGIRILTEPSPAARHGVRLARQPVVRLTDPGGADLSREGVAVSVSLGAGVGRLRGTATVTTDAAGVATFPDLALEGPPGSYTLAFGASGFTGAVSQPITLARARTSTAIRSDTPDPSVPGASVRVVFEVTSEGGTLAGNVVVRAEDGADCRATVAAGACSLSPSRPGQQQLVATYEGNEQFEPSTDAEEHRVEAPEPPPAPAPARTTTSIESHEPEPSAPGQAVTVRYRVTAASGSPLGDVVVTAGSGESCTGSVAAGACSLTLIQPGLRTIMARYAGSNAFAASEDTESHTVTEPAPTPTETRIESDQPDPSDPGQAVTVWFSVRSAAGSPAGEVTVSGGGQSCGGSLAGGSGSCILTLTTPGEVTLTAAYRGGGTFAPSEDTERHEVRAPAARILRLRTEPSRRARPGQPFERQPEVQLALEGGGEVREAGVPVTAALVGGEGSLQGGTTALTDDGGRAAFADLSIVGDGTYALEFSSSGYRSVTSSPVTVERPETETEITEDDPDPSAPGQPVEVRFRVRSRDGDPDGTVTVTGGGASCTAAVEARRCTLAPAGNGEITLTATYAGSERFGPSADVEEHRLEPEDDEREPDDD